MSLFSTAGKNKERMFSFLVIEFLLDKDCTERFLREFQHFKLFAVVCKLLQIATIRINVQ